MRARAWRAQPTDTTVDLFVEYVGFGAIFESVDRYYYSVDPDALKGSAPFNDASRQLSSASAQTPPRHSDRRHVQILDVPPETKYVYVRLADADDVPLSNVSTITVESGGVSAS